MKRTPAYKLRRRARERAAFVAMVAAHRAALSAAIRVTATPNPIGAAGTPLQTA